MKMEFTAEMIAGLLGGEVVGDKDVKVSDISSIEEGQEGRLAYLTNMKYEKFLYTSQASIVIVDKNFTPSEEVRPTLIKVDDAAQAIVKLLSVYSEAVRPRREGVSKLSSISNDATIGEEIFVGDFTVIEEGATIGNKCQIYPQVYIGNGVTIGENTIIYPGAKIYYGCKIGSNCIIHAGAVLGADGFGFALKADGSFDKIPQLGNVIVEDFVEIGANTCIDRAKTDSTIISRGVKLDNLIQVGHNVHIGENTVSSAQMGIAGSSSIGSNCFVGGQVGIADHTSIGNNCKIASQTGIEKPVPDNEVRYGFFPAMTTMPFRRSTALIKDLPALEKRIKALEKELTALKGE